MIFYGKPLVYYFWCSLFLPVNSSFYLVSFIFNLKKIFWIFL